MSGFNFTVSTKDRDEAFWILRYLLDNEGAKKHPEHVWRPLEKLMDDVKADGAVSDSAVALIRAQADQLADVISKNSPRRRPGRKSAGKAAKYRAAYKKLKSYAKVAKKYSVNVGTVWGAVNRGK
jgi:hypothetical protein